MPVFISHRTADDSKARVLAQCLIVKNIQCYLDDFDPETKATQVDELASLFKSTRAKAVLCILDCCFSGGAPAKVLEDSPIPRDPIDPYATLIGEGRVLLAASAVNVKL